MSFIRGGETITIRRRSVASTDDYGNPTYTTTNITIKDALIAVGGTSEPVDAERDAVDSSLTLYLPRDTVVQDGDVFIIRNSQWVKDGSAQQWVSPFVNFEAGVVVPVRKRVG
jgi:hypothetical protein